MKVSTSASATLLLVSSIGHVSAAFVGTRQPLFGVSAATMARGTTALKYTIVEPEDDGSADDNEPNLLQQKKQEMMDAKRKLYCENGITMVSGIDDQISVDSFSNPAGGIIPGMQLTALCGDD